MDISNTRVSSLLDKIHNVRPHDAGVDAGDGDDDGNDDDDDDDDDGYPYFATPYTPTGVNPFLVTPASANPFSVTPAGAGAGVGPEEVDGGKKRHAKTNKRSTRTKRRRHTRRSHRR